MWTYLPASDAAFFTWMSGAAIDWDLCSFVEMTNQLNKEDVFGYLDGEKMVALCRVAWILRPNSCYIYVWADPSVRRKKRLHGVLESLYHFLIWEKKIKKILAYIQTDSLMRLCLRYRARLVGRVDDLYYRGLHGIFMAWEDQ